LEHDGQEFTITSRKLAHGSIDISIGGATNLRDTLSADDVRLIGKIGDEDLYRGGVSDPDDLAHRLRVITDSISTFAFINSIPTPIFLGLDRTTLTPSPVPRTIRGGRARVLQSYFRTQLDDAILEAERLLTRQLSILSNERNKIFAELRSQFVLSLFVIPDVGGLNIDTLLDRAATFESRKYTVVYALERINIQPDAIANIVEPFFAEIASITKRAFDAKKDYDKTKDKTKNTENLFVAIGPLFNLAPSISIIERTLTKVEEATRNDKMLSEPLETYQRIMGSFFGDSGKALVFEENAVRVQLPSKKTADLTSLSSGERQIFVLITHLIFNPAIKAQNVLLIDEPELSLHLKWQRQFVTAIREASPSTQMILATHSPEIIFDRDNKLIELVIS